METQDTILYVVFLEPVDNSLPSSALIRDHASHLSDLNSQGRLIFAGPFTDSPSGMLIIRASNLNEVTEIMNEDPLVIHQVKTFHINTWLLANVSNSFLTHEK